MTKLVSIKKVTSKRVLAHKTVKLADKRATRKRKTPDVSKNSKKRSDAKFEEVRQKITKLTSSGEHKDSFYLFDVKNAVERIKIWRHLLPRVEIFYAVKTNTNSKIIQACLANNTGFDVASATEIVNTMKLGAKAESGIYESPVKKISNLLTAKQ